MLATAVSLLVLSPQAMDLVGKWIGKRVAVLSPKATEAQRATALLKAKMGGKGDMTLTLARDHSATVQFKSPTGQLVSNKGKWSQKGLHLLIVSKPLPPAVMIADKDGTKIYVFGNKGETAVVFHRAGK